MIALMPRMLLLGAARVLLAALLYISLSGGGRRIATAAGRSFHRERRPTGRRSTRGGTVTGATIAGMMLDAGNPGGFVFEGAATLAFSAGLAFIFIPAGPTSPSEPQPSPRTEFGEGVDRLRSQPAFIRVVLSRLVFFGAVLAADNILLFNLRDRLEVENPGRWSSILLGLLLATPGRRA